ncbi:MAG: hypothetical protein M3356_06445 [Actinomycetota bacterium]|nr:hypothetical protein [Actinomycetota bacterium]
MLTLPRGHSESELALARLLARRLRSEELYVFWSAAPPPPQVRPPESLSLAQGLTVLAAVVGVLASALGSRRQRPQPPRA